MGADAVWSHRRLFRSITFCIIYRTGCLLVVLPSNPSLVAICDLRVTFIHRDCSPYLPDPYPIELLRFLIPLHSFIFKHDPITTSSFHVSSSTSLARHPSVPSPSVSLRHHLNRERSPTWENWGYQGGVIPHRISWADAQRTLVSVLQSQRRGWEVNETNLPRS